MTAPAVCGDALALQPKAAQQIPLLLWLVNRISFLRYRYPGIRSLETPQNFIERKLVTGAVSAGNITVPHDVLQRDIVFLPQHTTEFDERFELDRKSTRLNSSHPQLSRMPSSA